MAKVPPSMRVILSTRFPVAVVMPRSFGRRANSSSPLVGEAAPAGRPRRWTRPREDAVTTAPAARPRTRWLLPPLSRYQWRWLPADIVAGIAAGAVVVPQAMAYATIANLPVQIGLYTCMAPMLVYALLGGSRTLSFSTTSTIALLVATSLAGLTGQSEADLLRAAFTLTFMVGVCLLGMRLLHLGALVESISPATLAGVRAG